MKTILELLKSTEKINKFKKDEDGIMRDKYIIDSNNLTIGEIAVLSAFLLAGKEKTHVEIGDKVIGKRENMDSGSYVEIKNLSKISKVSTEKMKREVIQRHSRYGGGFKQMNVSQLMQLDPKRVCKLAIRRMLPQNKLLVVRLKRVEVFA